MYTLYLIMYFSFAVVIYTWTKTCPKGVARNLDLFSFSVDEN